MSSEKFKSKENLRRSLIIRVDSYFVVNLPVVEFHFLLRRVQYELVVEHSIDFVVHLLMDHVSFENHHFVDDSNNFHFYDEDKRKSSVMDLELEDFQLELLLLADL